MPHHPAAANLISNPSSPFISNDNDKDVDNDGRKHVDDRDSGGGSSGSGSGGGSRIIGGGSIFLDWFLPCDNNYYHNNNNYNHRMKNRQQQQQHCADNVFIHMLPVIKQRLFAIPTTTTDTNTNNTNTNTSATSAPPMILAWGHKLRGFRSDYLSSSSSSSSTTTTSTSSFYQRDKNPYDQELGQDTIQRRDFVTKQQLVSYTTRYQHVDIYELQHAILGTVYNSVGRLSFSSSSSSTATATATAATVTDRVFFIDGVLQSSMYGEAVYHEALVHPALLAHPHPRRVAIM